MFFYTDARLEIKDIYNSHLSWTDVSSMLLSKLSHKVKHKPKNNDDDEALG